MYDLSTDHDEKRRGGFLGFLYFFNSFSRCWVYIYLAR